MIPARYMHQQLCEFKFLKEHEMKNRNDPKEQVAPEISQDDASATVPRYIPTNSWIDPYDKHPSMSWEEFIMCRFTRIL